MKNLSRRLAQWFRKMDQLIEERVEEIVELNASQNEMRSASHEAYASDTSPLTDRK
ncbi:MAG: hypothetical protein LAT75_10770 [Candidatus Cyclonatronum sp.]|uniref:hypothetical protein n=1 Tax=Cyclonatronum sp. TaxID=3024185 RepID=UPI0025BF42D1|nr:hypothetical protein [Cyclonatronum sp.]MCH8487336.1 hypothetical protein [Cyclonatronum sp.]